MASSDQQQEAMTSPPKVSESVPVTTEDQPNGNSSPEKPDTSPNAAAAGDATKTDTASAAPVPSTEQPQAAPAAAAETAAAPTTTTTTTTAEAGAAAVDAAGAEAKADGGSTPQTEDAKPKAGMSRKLTIGKYSLTFCVLQ